MKVGWTAPRWLKATVGLLSMLAVLGPITGDQRWLWFMILFALPVTWSFDTDERFFANVARAEKRGV